MGKNHAVNVFWLMAASGEKLRDAWQPVIDLVRPKGSSPAIAIPQAIPELDEPLDEASAAELA